MYDHIRMLDAEGYPRAFIEFGKFIIEFSDPIYEGEALEASVIIRKKVEHIV